ncbi:hypothetical protein [Aurantiacibacter rhizosphaerae]|nr:hypothetical protein [Aurantiacibacter rhizosphaerae]
MHEHPAKDCHRLPFKPGAYAKRPEAILGEELFKLHRVLFCREIRLVS